jgi:hypothetical protein
VGRAAFSADGRCVATASSDGTARVWDATTGQPITPPLQHDFPVSSVAFSPDGRHLLTAGGIEPGHWVEDNTARVWALPTDHRPAAELRRLARSLAGYRIDARAVPVPLEPAAARREEQALRAKYRADFTAAPTQVRAWQEREAERVLVRNEREATAAEEAGEWAAALPHLDALIAANPAQANLRARRSRAHGGLEYWEQTVPDIVQMSEHWPDLWWLRNRQAMAQLAGGDMRGYQRTCAAMLAHFSRIEDPELIYRLIHTCVVAPEGTFDAAQFVALGERLVARDPRIAEHPRHLMFLGTALYRAGRLEEAVQRLTAAGIGFDGSGWLFLAMAHARLGHPAEARQWLAKARTHIEPQYHRRRASGFPERVAALQLLREAEAMIPPAGAP